MKRSEFVPFGINALISTCVLAIALGSVSISSFAYGQQSAKEKKTVTEPQVDSRQPTKEGPAVATFGGGCFWCVEAVFENMKGVKNVVSGYAGGRIPNPSYQQVCTGLTGHAEVCQIFYDPKEVSYEELLEVFWKTHDPTTLNKQGNDTGPQYRSVIFYHDEEQKKLALEYKQKLDESEAFRRKIVTEISPLTVFFMAEPYHQDYFRNHPYEGYCMGVVRPKVEKFKKVFKDKVATPAK